jgi:hypothetical protein
VGGEGKENQASLLAGAAPKARFPNLNNKTLLSKMGDVTPLLRIAVSIRWLHTLLLLVQNSAVSSNSYRK